MGNISLSQGVALGFYMMPLQGMRQSGFIAMDVQDKNKGVALSFYTLPFRMNPFRARHNLDPAPKAHNTRAQGNALGKTWYTISD
jgi:hypothetical protein